MNRQIRLVGAGIMVLFVVLFLQLNYLQIVHAPALDHNTLNGARIVSEFNAPRGAIVSADGVTLANSVTTPRGSQFNYERLYPTGSLFADVTGYYSFIYGADGAEKSYNDILTGATDKAGFPTNLTDLRQLLTQTSKAQNITLTLSDKLQTVARNGLAGRLGSVVAIDPATGGILAMYSNPSYDPEQLSQLSTTKEQAAWKQLLAAPNNPLSPGAYRNRWFPGSSFKVITSSAVYDHDPALATKNYPVATTINLPDTTAVFHNFAGESCGGQLLALLTVSCDTGFAQVGLDLGAKNLYDEATSFGFDATPPLDLPDPAQSYFPPASSFAQNLPTLAYSAIGQEDVQATPLEMAMVVGAIADHGTMMTPHILSKVTNAQDTVVSTYNDKVWKQATTAATASSVTKLMEAVVNSPDGTGTAAAIPGVEVAGKTGTAQTGTHQTDDWFVAFAPAAHPTIAVAVVLPDQGFANEYQGGTLAAPIAKAVIEAWLSTHPAAAPPPSSTTTTPSSSTTAPVTTPATSPATAPVTTPVTTPATSRVSIPVTSPGTSVATTGATG
jgi:peptidoglycan glycosyltransferase